MISEEVQTTELILFGVSGKKLEIFGEQEIVFALNKRKFKHPFLVCKLPTKAAGILGVDFLLTYKAQLDLGKEEIRLFGSWKQGNSIARGLINPSALTIFSDSDDKLGKYRKRMRYRQLENQVQIQVSQHYTW
jgi:hypothetical protein